MNSLECLFNEIILLTINCIQFMTVMNSGVPCRSENKEKINGEIVSQEPRIVNY